jgi:hypothetical protein
LPVYWPGNLNLLYFGTTLTITIGSGGEIDIKIFIYADFNRSGEGLCEIVHPPAAGGYNFYDPVRSPGASFFVKLVGITDHADVRFYIVCVISIQKYGKGSKKTFAGTVLGLNVRVYRKEKFPRYCLVPAVGRCHIVYLAVNQFSPAVLRQAVDIINGIVFLLCQ